MPSRLRSIYRTLCLFWLTLFVSQFAFAVTPKIAAGFQFSLALNSDGNVFAWGSDAHGQLGQGRLTWSDTPVEAKGLPLVRKVVGGYGHFLALSIDGNVWAWGLNESGQLGDGGTTSTSIPFKVSGMSNVVEVAAGTAHTLALKGDGTVWIWGRVATPVQRK